MPYAEDDGLQFLNLCLPIPSIGASELPNMVEWWVYGLQEASRASFAQSSEHRLFCTSRNGCMRRTLLSTCNQCMPPRFFALKAETGQQVRWL